MEAIVTIIDDDGRVIEKDKVILPYDEILKSSTDYIATKNTYFRFGVIEYIDDNKINKRRIVEVE